MANTIKSVTTPIEKCALMPESLRLESEPWTPFYMAGEIIREARKACGKQSIYAREGSMTHSDKVIDHYDQPRSAGCLTKDAPNVGTGLVGTPECGDGEEMRLKITSETQVIEEADSKTFGCGSAIASSSLTAEWVKGKTSRKRWPSRTRISSASSTFPRTTVLDATGSFGITGRLHLGSLVF